MSEASNVLIALPEIVVSGMACVVLLVSAFARSRWPAYLLTQATLLAAAALVIVMPHAGQRAFNGVLVHDGLSAVLDVAVCLITAVVFAYSRQYLRFREIDRGEYFVLGLFGVVGMMVMIAAASFLTLYLGLELLSLSLYALVAFQRDAAESSEAAMKYFVLGALSSGVLLYGLSMLYGATGTLDIGNVARALAQGTSSMHLVLIFGLVFVVSGLAFKLGAAPFHMWIPDVYEGAPASVTLYVATAPKLAAFALFMRMLAGGLSALAPSWHQMLLVLAVLSLATGNIIAISQSNVKRMLGYSTISHMGFVLLGVLTGTGNGYGAALFYALAYAVMNLGAFGVIILLSREDLEAERLDDLKGLNRRSPWFAFMMLLVMFSLAGVPPTAGFFAKLTVIQALIDSGETWLAVVAMLFSVIGAFYYLRVVKLMYFDAPQTDRPLEGGRELKWLLSANGLFIIAITPWVGAVVSLCDTAIRNTFLLS